MGEEIQQTGMKNLKLHSWSLPSATDAEQFSAEMFNDVQPLNHSELVLIGSQTVLDHKPFSSKSSDYEQQLL